MNIVIMTIGCSGSTILVRMLQQMGWNAPDDKYMENPDIRQLNDGVLNSKEKFHRERAQPIIEVLPEPWVLKDPRFIQTFQHWQPILDDRKNCLIYLSRSIPAIKESLAKRGWGYRSGKKMILRGVTLEELGKLCWANFAQWRGPKVAFSYEKLKEAIGLFDLERSHDI